jgi:two-component system NtrC family sensor kinase
MPWRLSEFGVREMMECRGSIRDLFTDDPPTLEDAAERAVEFLRNEFVDERGNAACALVRFFKTHPYHDLPDDLRAAVRASTPSAAANPDLRCLTLIATRGDEPEWNSRHASRGHRAIPLVSVEMVQQAPMIAQLITQLGLPIAKVVRPSRSLLLDQDQKAHNVFYVPRALGSPHIVAQEDFVVRYGIASVLGFGGLLASGDLFAAIMFSKVAIPPDVADQFRVVGLNLKIAILPFARKPLFRDQ